MKKNVTAALFGLALMAGSASHAAVIGLTGQVMQIAAPPSVTNQIPGSNTALMLFDEVQNLTLGAAITTSSGVIAAGTRVSSHMLFLNRADAARISLTLSGTMTFDGAILGLITTTAGLAATDSILGAIGTSYDLFRNRGLEPSDVTTFIGDTLTASLRASQPGDWLRVITVAAVPVPAAGLLLVGALGGLAALRRRRSKALVA